MDEENEEKLRQNKEKLREMADKYFQLNLKKVSSTYQIICLHLTSQDGLEYEEILVPPSEGRIICFDLETTGFTTEDRYDFATLKSLHSGAVIR